MSRTKLMDIIKGIERPLEEVTPENKRAQFFRKLLLQHSVNEAKFNALLDEYIASKKPKAKFEALAMRSNLMKELARPTMNQKVLLRGLDFLKLPRSLADDLA